MGLSSVAIMRSWISPGYAVLGRNGECWCATGKRGWGGVCSGYLKSSNEQADMSFRDASKILRHSLPIVRNVGFSR
jgi:hypothetical protein